MSSGVERQRRRRRHRGQGRRIAQQRPTLLLTLTVGVDGGYAAPAARTSERVSDSSSSRCTSRPARRRWTGAETDC